LRLHLDKKGIRVLGVAESFKQGSSSSLLAGVVMRSDLVIDGVAIGRTSVGGDDATKSVASLCRRFRRNDLNLLMVSGAILSLYNIIDVDDLAKRAGLPVVCLTYKETSGIEEAIRRRFPDRLESKLEAYRKLGRRTRVRLASGHVVFCRLAGMERESLKPILDAFTLQGAVPEPVRVAKLVARAVLLRRS
jgi:uncharacterized protein